jgi:hypothetical protein
MNSNGAALLKREWSADVLRSAGGGGDSGGAEHFDLRIRCCTPCLFGRYSVGRSQTICDVELFTSWTTVMSI